MSILGVMFSVIFGAFDAPLEIKNCEYDSPFLTCDITSKADVAIRAVHFDAAATDLERTVPWEEPNGKKHYGAQISGGIEPGETIRQFLLVPKLPAQAQLDTFRLELLDITAYGADGEPLN